MIHQKVNAEAREMLMGHTLGLNDAYYKPSSNDILQEYLKAVNELTINEENRLKVKVKILESEKSKIDQLQGEVDRARLTFEKILPRLQKVEDLNLKLKELIRQRPTLPPYPSSIDRPSFEKKVTRISKERGMDEEQVYAILNELEEFS